MKRYKGIRISVNGRPTYGDKYVSVASEKELKYNDIITVGNARILILFEEEGE